MKFNDFLNEAQAVTKDKVLKLLIKYGNNPKDAEKMVDSQFDYAVKTYPNATASKIAEIVSTVSESNYEIKDGKVLITKKNYGKKHKDYKGGKKGAETLLVMDPDSGAAVSMPVQFINENEEEIIESSDLEKASKQFIKLVNANRHTDALVEAAKLTGDKKLIAVSEAILTILDYEGHNPISKYAHTIYSRVHEMGRKKFGEENWDKFIYQNT